jgi:predicted RND superfamily exporter protein
MFLAALPLFVGATWMVGLQALFGWKFDMMNFMAVPLIIGIGIDDGVHILHRYEIEGKASLPLVLRTTGRAVLLTTLTTMIAFGSWALATHKGTASMGRTLFLGVGTCFFSSILLLPAIITIIEKFNGKKV